MERFVHCSEGNLTYFSFHNESYSRLYMKTAKKKIYELYLLQRSVMMLFAKDNANGYCFEQLL